MLDSRMKTVGVFLDAEKELDINLLKEGVIDISQLHGSERRIEVGAHEIGQCKGGVGCSRKQRPAFIDM